MITNNEVVAWATFVFVWGRERGSIILIVHTYNLSDIMQAMPTLSLILL